MANILTTNYTDQSSYKKLFFLVKDTGLLILRSRELTVGDQLVNITLPPNYASINSQSDITSRITINHTMMKGILGEDLINQEYLTAIDNTATELELIRLTVLESDRDIITDRLEELLYIKKTLSKLSAKYLSAFDATDSIELSANRGLLSDIRNKYKFAKGEIHLGSFDRTLITDKSGNRLFDDDSTNRIKVPDAKISDVIDSVMMNTSSVAELELISFPIDAVNKEAFSNYVISELHFRDTPLLSSNGYFVKFNAANHKVNDIYQLVDGVKVFILDDAFDFTKIFVDCYITNISLGDYAAKSELNIIDKNGNELALTDTFIDGIPAALAINSSNSRRLPIPVQVKLPDILSFFRLNWLDTTVDGLESSITEAEDRLLKFREGLRTRFKY